MNLEIQFYLRVWKQAVGNTLNIRYDFVTNGGRSCLLDCTMRGQMVVPVCPADRTACHGSVADCVRPNNVKIIHL